MWHARGNSSIFLNATRSNHVQRLTDHCKVGKAHRRDEGYSVYDFEENQNYLKEDWIKIMTEGGTKEDFYRMYEDIDAAADIPACLFWEEISEAFPDVKDASRCVRLAD
uniref:uncharacterized protein LOC120347596 isoform X2 n=1 Tax=Styela clava TaxID=7725 RepID=UPI0019394CF2|nr:uncharacterized protein LOC120347596 isoform X2 [Styela clava]